MKVEPPSLAQIDRFVGSAVFAWESATAVAVTDQLGAQMLAAIEDLFSPTRRDLLTSLRADPGAVGVDTVIAELAKLEALRVLDLPSALFDGVSQRRPRQP